jgi:hypothetical protein
MAPAEAAVIAILIVTAAVDGVAVDGEDDVAFFDAGGAGTAFADNADLDAA